MRPPNACKSPPPSMTPACTHTRAHARAWPKASCSYSFSSRPMSTPIAPTYTCPTYTSCNSHHRSTCWRCTATFIVTLTFTPRVHTHIPLQLVSLPPVYVAFYFICDIFYFILLLLPITLLHLLNMYCTDLIFVLDRTKITATHHVLIMWPASPTTSMAPTPAPPSSHSPPPCMAPPNRPAPHHTHHLHA